MRKFRHVPIMLAFAVCANAQAHPVALNSACEVHHHFFPAHQIVLKPVVLQQPYQDFMATHVSTLCSAGNKSNPTPASCGGVTHAAFAQHTAQSICEQQSEVFGAALKYNVEMTIAKATSLPPPQVTYGYFPYALRITCGVCTTADIPPP